MESNPLRQREDNCCRNCPDHKEVTFSQDGKAITCRMGCAKWAAFEKKTAMRREKDRILYLGYPESKMLENVTKKKLMHIKRGRPI